MFTFTMLSVSVPADLRIFDMFSSAACCMPPVSILGPVPEPRDTYRLALDVAPELASLFVDSNAPRDIHRLATDRRMC